MPKEIIVNAGSRETRVALIDQGKLVELRVEREEQVAGSIYKCRVQNVLPGMDAAFVDIGIERNAFLYAGDVLPETGDEFPQAKKEETGRQNIKDLLKIGQEVLVQVVKAPRGTKGARVSTRISLPGRYLVLMPDADNIGISRKIDDKQERDRLKKIADKIKPQGFGFIVRTEAESKAERELQHDMDFLIRMWSQIQEKAKKTPAGNIIHQDLSLAYRTIRDVFGSDVHKMFIDNPIEYEKALETIELLSPRQKSKIAIYNESEPIFEHFSVEQEIDRLLKRKVWLKSGGHITIDQTEALTTIDVNTGKFIGSTSLSDTILKTNLESAAEIARQLRLRDIGGIIIIDFIDMSSSKDRTHVVTALDRALKKDRTRTKISNISPLGLVEMTRKRTGETISETMSEPCPYCQGRGQILSPESVSLQVERELNRMAAEVDDEAFLVLVNSEVAAYLIGGTGQTAEQLEKQVRRAVYIRSNPEMHVEKYEIIPGALHDIEQQMLPYKKGQIVECEVTRNLFVSLPRAAALADGYMIDLANGGKYVGQKVKARITSIERSYATGEAISSIKQVDLFPRPEPTTESEPKRKRENRPSRPQQENRPARSEQEQRPARPEQEQRPERFEPEERPARSEQETRPERLEQESVTERPQQESRPRRSQPRRRGPKPVVQPEPVVEPEVAMEALPEGEGEAQPQPKPRSRSRSRSRRRRSYSGSKEGGQPTGEGESQPSGDGGGQSESGGDGSGAGE